MRNRIARARQSEEEEDDDDLADGHSRCRSRARRDMLKCRYGGRDEESWSGQTRSSGSLERPAAGAEGTAPSSWARASIAGVSGGRDGASGGRPAASGGIRRRPAAPRSERAPNGRSEGRCWIRKVSKCQMFNLVSTTTPHIRQSSPGRCRRGSLGSTRRRWGRTGTRECHRRTSARRRGP